MNYLFVVHALFVFSYSFGIIHENLPVSFLFFFLLLAPSTFSVFSERAAWNPALRECYVLSLLPADFIPDRGKGIEEYINDLGIFMLLRNSKVAYLWNTGMFYEYTLCNKFICYTYLNSSILLYFCI